MGQFHDRYTSPRIEFDENSNNGVVIANMHIPIEILSEIFVRSDCKTLLNCHLVCKRWHQIIKSYVWRKKAENIVGRSLPSTEDMSWIVYYLVCHKMPFEKNLIINPSGEKGVSHGWLTVRNSAEQWDVENPPIGVPPLPTSEPIFKTSQSCFVTSFSRCRKMQIIDLVAEGLMPHIIDNLQPEIEISEWYSSRWDCPAEYCCTVKLQGENGIIDEFNFTDDIVAEKQNKWHRMSHVFKNYGPGLRKIYYIHGGKDKLFWAGHYGSKMAGASVCVKLPNVQSTNNSSTSHETVKQA